MNKVYYYRAFGLVISSEYPLSQLPETTEHTADVVIRHEPLQQLNAAEDCVYTGGGVVNFYVAELARFRVVSGSQILVDTYPGFSMSRLGVFLMGSCMGAILHQRGFFLLHGSCVTDGTRSVLITGDSGAGKSTLAAEFLKQGWSLLTDDVSAVYDVDSVPMVHSSYPSQKLWQDALELYDRPNSDVHSLYFNNDREKFGVDVRRFFYDGCIPLSMIVRLIPMETACSVSPIEGMAKVDQLMRNTYRLGMIEEQSRQRHFQRCVTLSTKIPMALAVRENGKQCAGILYDMITAFMEEHYHD